MDPEGNRSVGINKYLEVDTHFAVQQRTMETRNNRARGAGSDGNPGNVSKQGGSPVREISNSELNMEDGTIFSKITSLR